MDFEISVKTGDKRGAGTSANVSAILHCNGESSKETKLDNLFRNDFERGQTDVFKFGKQQFETVTSLELWRDDSGIGSNWYIDTITLKNVSTAWQTVFSIFRWIKANHRYKFLPYDTSLPQHEPDKERRQMELQEKRQLYQYTQRTDGFPCQVMVLPDDEKFSFEYIWNILKTAVELQATNVFKKLFTKSWKTMGDLKNVFTEMDSLFPEPSDCSRWNDDVKFGMQRFAGTNNTVISLCKKIPKKLAVTPTMLKPFLGSDTLESALQRKRLFIINHKILEGVKSINNTVVCSPIALFYRRDDCKIVPIAIQLFQDKADDNPVFLPSDPKYTWILAKMWFNNADACVHQANTHLGFTHIVMEGFVIAVQRHLSQSHPVFKLLAPHFLYLIAINERAVGELLKEGAIFDRMIAIGTNGVAELIKRYRPKWRMNVEGTLSEDLKARGVYDHVVVPHYPFRDDALLTFNAILKYVTSYVNLYYPSEDILSKDMEIQNWRRELDTPIEQGGLGVPGVPGEGGKFTSRDQLIQVVTSIIYTCSVGHAAANFKQYDEYAFPLNYPSLLLGKPPSNKTERSEKDIMQAIDRSRHLDVMVIVKILSERSTMALGNFEVNYINDPKAFEVVNAFRKELKLASETISERNKVRDVPFDWLDPGKIPNSISI